MQILLGFRRTRDSSADSTKINRLRRSRRRIGKANPGSTECLPGNEAGWLRLPDGRVDAENGNGVGILVFSEKVVSGWIDREMARLFAAGRKFCR